MRIIKEGKLENHGTKFTCNICSCEFECQEDEYWVETLMSLTSYPGKCYIYASCPFCHKVCKTTKMGTCKEYKVTLDGTSNAYVVNAKGKHDPNCITFVKDELVTPT